MRNMFFTASRNRFMCLSCDSSFRVTAKRSTLSYNLERAACLGNLFLRRRAEGLRVNSQLGRQLAVAKDLDGIGGAADEAMGAKQFGCHRLARRKNVELFQVHHRVRHAKGVVKPALRHAPVKRHLSAFKPTPTRVTAAGLLTLVAGAGGFAEL